MPVDLAAAFGGEHLAQGRRLTAYQRRKGRIDRRELAIARCLIHAERNADNGRWHAAGHHAPFLFLVGDNGMFYGTAVQFREQGRDVIKIERL